MASTCALTGSLIHLDGTPMKFAQVRAEVNAPLDYTGLVFLNEVAPAPRPVSTYSDKDGNFTLTLVRGMCFQLFFPGADVPLPFLVPDTDTAVLADIIFPRITQIDWSQMVVVDGDLTFPDLTITPSPDRVELAAGGSINVSLRVTYSDGRVSAFSADCIEAAPGTFTSVEQSALEITQLVPGDVVLTTSGLDDPYITLLDSLPVLQIPEQDYQVSLPSDLLIRFV